MSGRQEWVKIQNRSILSHLFLDFKLNLGQSSSVSLWVCRSASVTSAAEPACLASQSFWDVSSSSSWSLTYSGSEKQMRHKSQIWADWNITINRESIDTRGTEEYASISFSWRQVDIPLEQSQLCVRSLLDVLSFLLFFSSFPIKTGKNTKTSEVQSVDNTMVKQTCITHTACLLTSFCRTFSSLSCKEYCFTSAFSRLASIFFSQEEHNCLSLTKAENLRRQKRFTLKFYQQTLGRSVQDISL